MKKTVILCVLLVLAFSINGFAQRKAVSAAEATGTFSTGKNGNTMRIVPFAKGELKVEFSLIYMYKMPNGEWMANTGEPNGIAVIKGDTAVLDQSSEDGRMCRANASLFKNLE